MVSESLTIHQLTAGYTNGDAISNEARVMRDIFRSWGCRSDIFCETRRILPELRSDAIDISECAGSVKPADIALLHFSTGSMVNDAFAALPCRKVIYYHNMTPAHYLAPFHKQSAHILDQGRRQLEKLAGVADINMAVSRFNASELEAAGYRDIAIFPIVLDLEMLKGKADRRVLREYSDGRKNILFVGRCVPNKRIENLILAFSVYKKHFNPDARLIHVGSYNGFERYYYALQAFIKDLHVEDVILTGAVPQSHLNAFYECADLFLCMSEHEGFCIPVMESMIHEVPVMAYAAAAVPETLDGAGILFRDKDFDMIAGTIDRVLSDQPLRQAVIARQNQRLAQYSSRDLGAELRGHLAPLMENED